MAFYAYKHVVHDWPEGLQERWEAAEGREYDGNVNYDGDAWLVTAMWIDELKTENTRLRTELAEARAERDAARRERDERPAIAPHESYIFLLRATKFIRRDVLDDAISATSVWQALRAHAASLSPPSAPAQDKENNHG